MMTTMMMIDDDSRLKSDDPQYYTIAYLNLHSRKTHVEVWSSRRAEGKASSGPRTTTSRPLRCLVCQCSHCGRSRALGKDGRWGMPTAVLADNGVGDGVAPFPCP